MGCSREPATHARLPVTFRPEGKMCRQQILHSITFNTIRAKIWKAKDCLSDPVVARVSRNGPQSILGFKASSNDMSYIKIFNCFITAVHSQHSLKHGTN